MRATTLVSYYALSTQTLPPLIFNAEIGGRAIKLIFVQVELHR
jgi:hypothetical protein